MTDLKENFSLLAISDKATQSITEPKRTGTLGSYESSWCDLCDLCDLTYFIIENYLPG